MTSQSKNMKVQCLNSDRIGSLPQDITGNILTRMPIRDAIRTSILSRKWRSGWKSMTKLVFDDKMVIVPSNCQQLKKYKLAGGSRDFARGNKFTFVELLQCVPLIETLEIEGFFMEYLSAGGMPHKFPTSLVQLKKLFLRLCYDEEDEVSSALCLIRSSPNLEEIHLTRHYHRPYTAQISKNFPDIQDYSGFALDHLEFFWMKYFANKDCEVEFLKLIMAKSPMLKKAQIELDESVSLEEENKMLRNLIQLPIPHASSSAKLIIKRPNPAS